MTEAKQTTKKTTARKDPGGIHAAFVSAWAEIHTVGHDGQANYGKYTTYDAIIQFVRPIFGLHNLAIVQKPCVPCSDECVHSGSVMLETELVYKDGSTIDLGTIVVPVKKENDPQAFGSSMTYAKRYALCAALAIPSGDDDDGDRGAEPDYRTIAANAIITWSGMSGQDAKSAMRQVVQMASTNDPKKLIEYVNNHKSESFIEHMNTKEAVNG